MNRLYYSDTEKLFFRSPQASDFIRAFMENNQKKFLIEPANPRLDIPVINNRIRPQHLPQLRVVTFPQELFTRPDFLKPATGSGKNLLEGWKKLSKLNKLRAVW